MNGAGIDSKTVSLSVGSSSLHSPKQCGCRPSRDQDVHQTVLRSGASWRDLPERYGSRTTCYNRFVRWRKSRRVDRMTDAITDRA